METVDDPYVRHYYDDDSISNIYSTEVTNLSLGVHGPDLLKICGNIMLTATRHRMEKEEREGKYYLFQYGPAAGLWECRYELQKFLSRRYGDPVAREQLVITCGASHGLFLLLATIIASNGVIFVEEVTYVTAIDTFKQFPLMRIISVPMTNGVIDLDAFEKLIRTTKDGDYLLSKEKIYWAMLYSIPTFQNPTGMTLPPESCKRLVKIARDNQMVVVCDDVYNLLYYGAGSPPHRLLFYDDPNDDDYLGGNVISNGSFTKILSPGIRLGWIECRPRVANILRASGIMNNSGAANHYLSGVITSLFSLGIQDQYLDKLIETFHERLTVVCEILDRSLPKHCFYRKPEGGLFVWIRLPKGCDGEQFVAWCKKEYKVTVYPGVFFSYKGESKNYLRLSIAFHQTKDLRKAVPTLCTALQVYIGNDVEGEIMM